MATNANTIAVTTTSALADPTLADPTLADATADAAVKGLRLQERYGL